MKKQTKRNNKARKIIAKKRIILKTGFGDYVIAGIDNELNAVCYPPERVGDYFCQRTFCLHGGHIDEIVSGKTVI